MKRITLHIDDHSKLGKAILDLLVSTSKESNAVQFIHDKSTVNALKSKISNALSLEVLYQRRKKGVFSCRH